MRNVYVIYLKILEMSYKNKDLVVNR